MFSTTQILLKHGVENLILENHEFFKQNITQALALKLHESFKEIKKNITEKLLTTEKETQNTSELKEFVEFINFFSPGIYKFKNGSSINISESDMQSLKSLFEALSPENRKNMVSQIFEDGTTFKQHINFSQKVKQLL